MILWQRYATLAWIARNETRLHELAGSNVAIISRPGRSRSLIEVSCPQMALGRELQREFGGSAKRLLNDWRKPFSPTHPPIRVGRRLQIVSSFGGRRPPLPPEVLGIPAADAFGTGEHSSTAMALRLLEEATRKIPPSWHMLDAGTGTGILALAARKLGADASIGLDNDPRAVTNARHNARLNHIARAKFLVADIVRFKPTEGYELVTANLFSELLIAALPIFRRALKSEGLLILSGILREQTDAAVTALGNAGFEVEKKRRRGKWVALQARRKKQGAAASDRRGRQRRPASTKSLKAHKVIRERTRKKRVGRVSQNG